MARLRNGAQRVRRPPSHQPRPIGGQLLQDVAGPYADPLCCLARQLGRWVCCQRRPTLPHLLGKAQRPVEALAHHLQVVGTLSASVRRLRGAAAACSGQPRPVPATPAPRGGWPARSRHPQAWCPPRSARTAPTAPLDRDETIWRAGREQGCVGQLGGGAGRTASTAYGVRRRAAACGGQGATRDRRGAAAGGRFAGARPARAGSEAYASDHGVCALRKTRLARSAQRRGRRVGGQLRQEEPLPTPESRLSPLQGSQRDEGLLTRALGS